ncbi:MAG TPA: hypothetical protein VF129_13585 [Actinomycetota bacterium]
MITVAALLPACVQAVDVAPECRVGDESTRVLTLAAQAVPTATMLPCLDVLLPGWSFEGIQITDGAYRFWLSSDRTGIRTVRVELVSECDLSAAVEVVPAPGEEGTRRFEEPLSLDPVFAANRYYTFAGGCVRVEYRFGSGDPTEVLQADQAIGFRPRASLVRRLADLGIVLCGAGAPPCPGTD